VKKIRPKDKNTVPIDYLDRIIKIGDKMFFGNPCALGTVVGFKGRKGVLLECDNEVWNGQFWGPGKTVTAFRDARKGLILDE